MISEMNVLGVKVSVLNMKLTIETLDQWIEDKKSHYVCVRDIHGLMRCQDDEKLREIHWRAGLVMPDGMPLVWIGKMRKYKEMERVCGPDFMPAYCEHSVQKGHRHFFYGGKEGVPELLSKKLKQRFPGLNVVGTYSPPFRPLTPEEDEQVIEQINQSGADVVWVGLSTPRQEYWMADHIGKLDASVMLGVGAAFDFHADLQSRAPSWFQRNGLEWMYRLAMEPRRLGGRYFYYNSRFLLALLKQWI